MEVEQDPPPDYDLSQEMKAMEEKEMEQARCSAACIASEPAILTLKDHGTFRPGRSLRIQTHGIGLVRLPVPSGELEIPIYNVDGSVAYVSKRRKRYSGDAVLSHPKLGEIVSTSYFFGPNNDPVIELLQAPDPEATAIKVSGRWTSRSTNFVTPLGRAFEWSYAKQKDAHGKKISLLVLKRTDSDVGKKGKVIAQLVRSDETRTPGSFRSSAGNGGELLLDRDACEVVDEGLIVATCLLMLKREIDRRRMLQMAALVAIAGVS